jgi:hypothetical protein
MWSASLEIGQFFVPATFGRLIHHSPLSLMVLLPCNNVSIFFLFYGVGTLSVEVGLTSVSSACPFLL